jgi:acetyltransferase-like isoleucine patch superfamily enzyme
MKLISLLKKIFRYFFPVKPFCIVGDNCIIDKRAHIYNSSGNKNNITIGNNSCIDGELLVWKNAGKINIGENTYIGLNTRIWSAKYISIGNRVQIAHNTNVFDSNIHSLDPKKRFEEYKRNTTVGLIKDADWNEKEIFIDDDAWIGANVIILKGVNIGKASIVGAGSVVVKDVPANSIVVGNPAHVIKVINS